MFIKRESMKRNLTKEEKIKFLRRIEAGMKIEFLTLNTADEEKPFKCIKTGNKYSFEEIQDLGVRGEILFCFIDKLTEEKFIEEIEAWC
jgi:hypothetical protein